MMTMIMTSTSRIMMMLKRRGIMIAMMMIMMVVITTTTMMIMIMMVVLRGASLYLKQSNHCAANRLEHACSRGNVNQVTWCERAAQLLFWTELKSCSFLDYLFIETFTLALKYLLGGGGSREFF